MDTRWVLLIVVYGCHAYVNEQNTPMQNYRQTCEGEMELFALMQDNAEHRYEHLKKMFTGCEYVEKSVVLNDFNDKTLDFSFLSSIKEIRGSLIIYDMHITYLPFLNLQLIRGDRLFRPSLVASPEGYSLYVLSSDYHKGLHVMMPKLTEISKGSIKIVPTSSFCYLNKIKWQDIVEDITTQNITSFAYEEICGKCHSSCQLCWGPKKENCQSFFENCPNNCANRCTQEGDCCHDECSAGCYGNLDSQCHSCKNIQHANRCVSKCPSRHIYDRIVSQNVPNPESAYNYLQQCVKQCPENTLIEDNSCVTMCNEGFAPDFELGVCLPCGRKCPKACTGTGHFLLNSITLKNFVNCTIVNGNLYIGKGSFERKNIIQVADLYVLQDIEVVTGYVHILDLFTSYDLSFLKNLRVIGGQNINVRSLIIANSGMKELGLASLKSVLKGDISIENNADLCLVDTVNWNSITKTKNSKITIGYNRNQSDCVANGFTCTGTCDQKEGCMGKGNDHCIKCDKYQYADYDQNEEDDEEQNSKNYEKDVKGDNEKDEEDKQSDKDEMADDVNGSDRKSKKINDEDKTMNENWKKNEKGNLLRASTSEEKVDVENKNSIFNNEKDYIHENSNTNTNRTIATKKIRKNKKLRSDIRRRHHHRRVKHAIPVELDYYPTTLDAPPFYTPKNYNNTIKSSTKPTSSFNTKLQNPKNPRHFRVVCLLNCTSYSFKRPLYRHDNATCKRCHEQCVVGCDGPFNTDCWQCANYNHSNHCVMTCPSFSVASPSSNVCNLRGVYYNAKTNKSRMYKSSTTVAVGVVVVVMVLLLLVVMALSCRYKHQADKLENKLRYENQLNGVVECEPLNESSVEPNMAKLKLVKESELKKGGIIGSGAFGTVYKGVWKPEESDDRKISVAIKILQPEISSDSEQDEEHCTSLSLDDYGTNKCADILEEAKIMASVVDPFCISILGICMSRRVYLITNFMPLGCLLDYVRLNKDSIDSKLMMNWCLQIAKGMSYLEHMKIIHRDLAARNVLVQTPTHIRITDFGLAKLVQNVNGVYMSQGGKLPVKWLALESIREKIFTHKSDVWSFGVTLWEIFSYGRNPYSNLPIQTLLEQLERGERLSQPSICTIDVFMVLIKCWLVDSNMRPSFKNLVDSFQNMASDPARYLVIENDKLKKQRRLSSSSDHRTIYTTTTNTTNDSNNTNKNTSNNTNNNTPNNSNNTNNNTSNNTNDNNTSNNTNDNNTSNNTNNNNSHKNKNNNSNKNSNNSTSIVPTAPGYRSLNNPTSNLSTNPYTHPQEHSSSQPNPHSNTTNSPLQYQPINNFIPPFRTASSTTAPESYIHMNGKHQQLQHQPLPNNHCRLQQQMQPPMLLQQMQPPMLQQQMQPPMLQQQLQQQSEQNALLHRNNNASDTQEENYSNERSSKNQSKNKKIFSKIHANLNKSLKSNDASGCYNQNGHEDNGDNDWDEQRLYRYTLDPTNKTSKDKLFLPLNNNNTNNNNTNNNTNNINKNNNNKNNNNTNNNNNNIISNNNFTNKINKKNDRGGNASIINNSESSKFCNNQLNSNKSTINNCNNNFNNLKNNNRSINKNANNNIKNNINNSNDKNNNKNINAYNNLDNNLDNNLNYNANNNADNNADNNAHKRKSLNHFRSVSCDNLNPNISTSLNYNPRHSSLNKMKNNNCNNNPCSFNNPTNNTNLRDNLLSSSESGSYGAKKIRHSSYMKNENGICQAYKHLQHNSNNACFVDENNQLEMDDLGDDDDDNITVENGDGLNKYGGGVFEGDELITDNYSRFLTASFFGGAIKDSINSNTFSNNKFSNSHNNTNITNNINDINNINNNNNIFTTNSNDGIYESIDNDDGKNDEDNNNDGDEDDDNEDEDDGSYCYGITQFSHKDDIPLLSSPRIANSARRERNCVNKLKENYNNMSSLNEITNNAERNYGGCGVVGLGGEVNGCEGGDGRMLSGDTFRRENQQLIGGGGKFSVGDETDDCVNRDVGRVDDYGRDVSVGGLVEDDSSSINCVSKGVEGAGGGRDEIILESLLSRKHSNARNFQNPLYFNDCSL